MWTHPGADLNPFTVPSSAVGSAGKSEVNRLWPRSTQSGSQGGHDTERAAVEIARTLDPADGTVMVLLTNTAYSVASGTRKPIGDSDPAFKTLLTSFKRLPAQNSSGASLPLPFTELSTDRTRSLDAVILVPVSYSAAALDTSRDALLGGSSATDAADTSAPTSTSGLPWWALVAAGLAVLGAAAFVLLRPRKNTAAAPTPSVKKGGALSLEVEGQPFVLSAAGAAPLSVRLVRQGYAASDERTAVLNETRLPTVLATLEQNKQGLDIKLVKNVKLSSINGQPATKPVIPLQAGSYRLEFKGTYQEKESLPPKPFAHVVRVRLAPSAPATPRPVSAK